MYHVIDNQTGAIKGTYQTNRRAHARADKLDLEYGSIRYRVTSAERHAQQEAQFAFAQSLIRASK
jgi:hypothetical protein